MSVQQRIASDVYRMAEKAVTPEQIKSIQAHLVKSVQTGSVPSYVGIPLLNDLNQKMARIQTAPAQAQAMVQQPPVAQQIMGQAEQGVETLPSGLPEEGMAGGGIVAFADGGSTMSPSQMAEYLLADEDDDDADYVNAILGDMYKQEAASTQESDDEGLDGLMATTARESVSTQESGEPARGVTRERTSVSGPAGLESLLKMIEQKESGGRDYDKYGRLLTSPAGAQGRMHVMPATSRDPGFGIRPAKEGDVEDLARVGREYYTKMLERYGDPKVAAIAYNWGPGNTDNWLKSGAGIDKLPRETRNYVANMREGGIARFQNTGLVDFANMTPEEIKETMRRRIKMEGARDAFTRAPAAPAAPAAAPAAAPSAASNPTYGQRLMKFLSPSGGAAGPLAGIGALGGAMSYGAANQMSNLSQEQREQLTGDIGSDTGFAAAIMNAAQPSEKKAGVTTLPKTQQPRMPVTASNTTGQSYKRTQGPTKEGMEEAELLSGIDLGGPGSSPATLTPPEPDQEKEMPKEEGGIRSILDKFRGDISKQRDIDNYMSLLSAGLGMMGGTSPFASSNIGQGALQGVRTYQQAAQQRSADERGLLSAELGLKKYEQLGDIRKAQLQYQKEKAKEDKDIKQARLLQGQQKIYSDQLNEIRRLAQTKALAEHKGTLLQEEKDRIMAQAETKLLQDPAYRALYEKVYGFKPGGSGGGMSSERASQFKVER